MHVSDEWYIQGQTADGVHVHEQAVSLQGVKREKGKAWGGGCPGSGCRRPPGAA